MERRAKRNARNLIQVVIGVLLLLSITALAAEKPKAKVEERRKQLDALLKEQWEYVLKTNPEFATILGDKRYNDKVSDVSEKAVYADLAMTKKFLARFEAVDTAGFPEQEQLNKTLMIRGLKEQLDDAQFEGWLMPVNQFTGIHIDLPQFVSLVPFDTVKDYEDYAARLKQFPALLDETVVLMRKGASKNLIPPKILLEKVVKQVTAVGGQKPEESPFAQPVKKFPATFSDADQKRLREAVLAAIHHGMNPAYERFGKFVRDEYADKGRKDPGMWSLPDGDARYAARVKSSTTTEMTPEEIHQLGLKEVARIEGEMLKVANRLGFKDLKSFYESVEKNPELRPKSRQEMLDLYRKYTDQMYTKIPQLFGRLPKAKVEILPVEAGEGRIWRPIRPGNTRRIASGASDGQYE
jgi:uncharacterized protein (DUF885 family)